jgi:carboxy-cis,cis-muconate cyclase
MKKWSSYAVGDRAEITHNASHPMGGHRRFNQTDTRWKSSD